MSTMNVKTIKKQQKSCFSFVFSIIVDIAFAYQQSATKSHTKKEAKGIIRIMFYAESSGKYIDWNLLYSMSSVALSESYITNTKITSMPKLAEKFNWHALKSSAHDEAFYIIYSVFNEFILSCEIKVLQNWSTVFRKCFLSSSYSLSFSLASLEDTDEF